MPLLPKTLTSHDIRHQFLDYFIQSNTFIRSSPVVPYCDGSLAFVNSGMNQFKNVFLGKSTAPYLRGVNTQKCVRVDGKHNDMSVAGKNPYHHTFFEMLGTWSFGDCLKKEACENAWNLLKGPYQIDTSRLYVTYFGGDENLQLPPDYECKDIWRSLGISGDRILPMGIRENFWFMGSTGPCGPSTEILINHIPNGRVNAGLSDLTELWNVVFIEYNLNDDGSLSSLPIKHIDTGMGLERLAAILQGKTSNYETDLFRPIIDRIQQVAKSPNYVNCYDPHDRSYEISTAYRTLADHTRMITACLADGMIPEKNQKLRHVLRKCFSISTKIFRSKNLLHEIVPTVIEILGDTYPEMQQNFSHIQQIIRHECNEFDYSRNNKSSKLNKILEEMPRSVRSHSGELKYELQDTYGLNKDIGRKITETENLELGQNGLAEYLTKRNRIDCGHFQVPSTDSLWKYSQEYNKTTKEFVVPNIKAKIIAMEDRRGGKFDIILNKTNFYYESGGQSSDVGQMIHKTGVFDVEKVNSIDHVVIHSGKFFDCKFELNDVVELVVDGSHRTANARNHTATHLLQASVKKVTNSVVYEKSSYVNPSELKLDLEILGYKENISSIKEIEKLVRSIIRSSSPVTTTITYSHGLYHLDGVTLVPGEMYPDSNLRIVSIKNKDHNFTSKEPCCGTHASNTAQLEDFCITKVKVSGRRSFTFFGITGCNATQAHLYGKAILNETLQLKSDFDKQTYPADGTFDTNIQRIQKILSQSSEFLLPYVIKRECLDIIDLISTPVKDMSRESLNFTDGQIRARCCVPLNYVTHKFSANLWLRTITDVFDAEIRPSCHGQTEEEVCHMTPRKLNSVIFDEKLKAAMQKAVDYARDNM